MSPFSSIVFAKRSQTQKSEASDKEQTGDLMRQEVKWIHMCVYECWGLQRDLINIWCICYFPCCYNKKATWHKSLRKYFFGSLVSEGLVQDGGDVLAEQLWPWWEHVEESVPVMERIRKQSETVEWAHIMHPKDRPPTSSNGFPKLSSTFPSFQNHLMIAPLA